jgi:hypothetical protein
MSWGQTIVLIWVAWSGVLAMFLTSETMADQYRAAFAKSPDLWTWWKYCVLFVVIYLASLSWPALVATALVLHARGDD